MKDSDWEILYELHKNPNLTKVANMLYMTQPSLTKRLQHMEEEFGIPIVNRMPKGLVFTQEGDYLASRAEQYLKFLEETHTEVDKMKTGGTGTITIGSSYTYSKYALSDLLLEYRISHPNIQFTIINEKSDELYKQMLEEKVDCAFVRGDYDGPVNRVFVEKGSAYLVTKEPTPLDRLPEMQYLGYKTNRETIEKINLWWKDWFMEETPANMVIGYVDVAWQMIHKGLGYTCCFLPDQFENIYDLCLSPLLLKNGTPITRNTWFLYSQNKRQSVIVQDFIEYVEKIMKEKKQAPNS